MVFSLFSGLSVITAAESVEDCEPADVIERVNTMDLTDSGAELDLAESGHYNIAIGKTTITTSNRNDVLNDGGSVKYNPTTGVLTLNNPYVNNVNGDDYGVIHIQAESVTVKGSFHMTRSLSRFGLYATEDVVLDGDFTFYGTQCGMISGDNTIIVQSGSVKSISTGIDDGSDPDKTPCGVYCDNFVAEDNINKIEMQGRKIAFIGDLITFNHNRVTSPTDAFFSEDARTIIRGDYTEAAANAVIEPFTGSYYDLWLGSRHVTSENCSDIFGDGKAVFDPSSNTLTLNNPTLVGAYTFPDNLDNSYKIYSGMDLTVKGSYHIKESELDFIPSEEGHEASDDLHAGIYSTGKLNLDGDFTFYGVDYPLASKGDLTIESGTVLVPKSTRMGIFSENGSITIKTGVIKVDAQGDVFSIIASEIHIGDEEMITTPSNAVVAKESQTGFDIIYDVDNDTGATHTVIEYKENYTDYSLFLGNRQVNSENRNDIFNDGGSAKYDPVNKILTLSNPTIPGTVTNAGNTYKILTSEELTITGSYHMSSAESMIGILSTKSLTFNGDFTFKGTANAAYAQDSITIKSGTFTAQSSGSRAVVAIEGTFRVESGVTKVDLTAGSCALLAKDIKFGAGVSITTPANAAFGSDPGLGLIGIYDVDASAYAKHAVIEYKEPVINYNVSLGATQVTSKNKDDILNDGGRAKYDPDTKTLTLNDPTISGAATMSSNTFKIYSYDDLTIKGIYHMPSADADFGVYSYKGLTFDGEFTFKGSTYAVYAFESITIRSGSFTAQSDSYIGVMAYKGALSIENDISKVDMKANKVGAYGKEIKLGTDVSVTTPSNSKLDTDSSYGLIGVYDNDKSRFADHVVIEPKTEPPTELPTDPPTEPPTQPPTQPPTEEPTQEPTQAPTQAPIDAPGTTYEVWVGSTQVTFENKDDILNDGGKAKFDPSTNTLTLNNPTIVGGHNLWSKSGYSKISSFISLTIKGSYHMTSPETVLGVGVKYWRTLTLDGDFTFCSSDSAVYCDGSVVLESGTVELTATGSDNYGINCGGSLQIHEGFTKLHVIGTASGYGAIRSVYEPELCDGAIITTPENGVIQKITSAYSITDSSGNAAREVVIEVFSAIGLEGQGTAGAPYLIKTTADWNTLAQYIADGGKTSGRFFKMTNHISVSTALGVSENRFSGVFDGDGNTLTLDNMSGAPFSIEGATIKNLKVDGFVSGGRHVSALVGGIGGTAENRIENCVVAATVTTSDTYCGGFIGHGGNKAKTVLSNCVFSGTINGSTAGTFWGWSDNGATPVLENCLDLSDSSQPIGRGEPKNATVTNCYYTKDGKQTGGGRPWSNQGKRAYTITGDGISLSGAPGIQYNGTIYAAEGEKVTLTVSDIEELYNANAGTLDRNGNTLTLTMPAKDVSVAKPENVQPIPGYSNAVGTGGNNNEGPENFVDGKTDTKWCYSSSSYPLSITFESNDTVTPFGYILTTANDTAKYPERNPISWKLEGSADGENWTTLSSVSNNETLEAKNYTPYTFPLSNPEHTSFSYYRFTVNATKGGGTFQLSELQLIGNSEPTVKYDLWVGPTQVTFKNKDDILKDGGKAKFDPDTNTLTLSDPTINGVCHLSEDSYKFKIYSKDDLTIKGSYHMPENDAIYGAYSEKALTLDGNFTFRGKYDAVYSSGLLTVKSGTLTLIADGNGINGCENGLTIENGVTRIDAQGDVRGVLGKPITMGDKMIISSPEGAIIKEDPYGYGSDVVCESDGSAAKHVIIEHKLIQEYNLWLGSVQVNDENSDDILNDGGKAKFDPDTNTLTLDDPVIEGCPSRGTFTAKIFADGLDLTVRGNYHMIDPEGNYALRVLNGSLTFDGDFTIRSYGYAASSSKDLTLAGGSMKAYGKENCALRSNSKIIFGSGIYWVEAKSNDHAVLTEGNIEIAESLKINTPENGAIGNYSDWGKTIVAADGSAANHVIIEPAGSFHLWLGDTQVTAENKDDILNDGGKAKYDPETNTLTLSDPTITGLHNDAKIYAEDNLTIKGSYHMSEKESEADATYAVKVSQHSYNHLTLDGDFTFIGTHVGVMAPYLEIRSGAVKAVGLRDEGFGLYATYIGYRGTIVIGDGVETVDAQGDEVSITANEIILGDKLTIRTPENGKVDYEPGMEGYWKTTLDADGNLTKHAVILGPYTVTFDANGHGEAPAKQSVKYGSTVTKPADPAAEGYTFGGWFTDQACTNAYDFSKPVTDNLILYAKWTENPLLGDVDGDGVVSIIDVTYIQKKLASVPLPFVMNERVADADEDGKLSIIDATFIQKWLASIKSNDNIGKPIKA